MATVFIRTIIIYIILTGTMRIMGKRQIGELEISELIVTFMLSELATIPISDTDIPILYAIIPICLLLSIEGMLSFITVKVPLFKKIVYGKPSILIADGKLDQKELVRQRIELSELLCAIRQNGIASLDQVSYAMLEENGKISVFQKESHSPATPTELGINTEEDGIALPLIMDRRVIRENMEKRGWDDARLQRELRSRRLDLSGVFLLSVDSGENIYIIRKEKK